MAFLNKGLEIRFKDERTDPVTEQNFLFKGGIVDFVKHLNASKEPIFKRVVAFEEQSNDSEVEIAMQWNTGYYEGLHSFANNIATTEGGMHEEGFKKALTNAVNKYGRARGLLKEKEDNLLGEDIREGLTAIISVKLRNPQFEGQTKTKLGNAEMRSLVEKATNDKLGDWLEEHPSEAKQIMTKATAASRARMAAKQARDLTRRKNALETGGLPGKLADCSSREPVGVRALHRGGELGRVVGQGRARPAHPGDPPDPRQDPQRRARPHGQDAEERGDPGVDHRDRCGPVGGVRRGQGALPRIIILADADVDGSHIRTLLLTFFFRQMPQLFERGFIYVAQPPLYSAVLGKTKSYLKDEAALTAFLAENEGRKPEIARLKGLGEMDFEELWETTMDPARRDAVAGLGGAGRDRRRGVLDPHGRRRRVTAGLHPAEREGRPLPRHLGSRTNVHRSAEGDLWK